MKGFRKYFNIAILGSMLFAASSCSNNTTKADDQDVASMDSVADELEKSNKELDEKAKQLEASLEKVDKELDTVKVK